MATSEDRPWPPARTPTWPLTRDSGRPRMAADRSSTWRACWFGGIVRRLVVALASLLVVGLAPAESGAYASALSSRCAWDVPSSGFNPFTATAEQLAAEGDFPARPPAGTKAETDWVGYANAYLVGRVPTCIGGTPNPQGVSNTFNKLGGWGVHNQAFTDTDAIFYVPTTVTGADGAAASYWAGINLATNCPILNGACVDPLIQGGVNTEVGVSGYAPCHLWWEVWPYNGEIDFQAPGTADCQYGDSIYAHATFTSSGAMSVHVVDETPPHYSSNYSPPGLGALVAAGTCDGTCENDGHAERVAEWDRKPNDLAHWSTPPWTDGIEFAESRAAAATGGWKYYNQLSNYTINMVDEAGTVIATPFPTGLGTVGDGPTYWLHPN
jgi:hypothetical protein